MIRNFFRIFGRGAGDAGSPDGATAIGTSGIVVARAAPSFRPLNPLEVLLAAAAHDPARRPEFNRHLLEAPLYAVSPDLPASRGMALPPGAAPRLQAVPGPDGRALPALFSAPERVAEKLGARTGFFAADGARLLALVADHGAVLNPDLGYGVHWTPADCAVLLGRPVERRRVEDAQLLLGAPSDPPEPLVAGLRAALSGDARIDGAWLALAHWPGRDGLSWYLDVRTLLDRGEIERRIAPVFRAAGLAGRTLDLAVLPPGGEGAGLLLTGAPQPQDD